MGASGMVGRGYCRIGPDYKCGLRLLSALTGLVALTGWLDYPTHSRRYEMERRRLGRTGHMSSVVTFGAAGIGRVPQDVADRAIEAALAHGVNHIDVAPRYGDAELRLKPWMRKIRGDVFLGCKTIERTRETAAAELGRSLERLGTDRVDLYQLHS